MWTELYVECDDSSSNLIESRERPCLFFQFRITISHLLTWISIDLDQSLTFHLPPLFLFLFDWCWSTEAFIMMTRRKWRCRLIWRRWSLKLRGLRVKMDGVDFSTSYQRSIVFITLTHLKTIIDEIGKKRSLINGYSNEFLLQPIRVRYITKSVLIIYLIWCFSRSSNPTPSFEIWKSGIHQTSLTQEFSFLHVYPQAWLGFVSHLPSIHISSPVIHLTKLGFKLQKKKKTPFDSLGLR